MQQLTRSNSESLVTNACFKEIADDYNNTLPWYHGAISKETSRKLLSTDKDEVFLVKDSAKYPGDFTLCIRYKTQFYEYRIKRYHSGKLTIEDINYFDSLEELIEFYKYKRAELCMSLSSYILKECNVTYISYKYIYLEHSGYGEFGRFYTGTYNDRKVLLKTVRNVDAIKGMLRKSVCHENLMNLVGLTKFNKMYYLVSSFSKQGTLLDLLRIWARTTYVRKFSYNFCYDICNGMDYLERKCIVHKHLAARNIWITYNGVAKLSNFGLFDEYIDNFKYLPYRHLAPEALIAMKHSHMADVWSFGVTLWEIFTNGAVPYTDFAYFSILKLLRNGERLPKPRNCPNNMYCTMQHCWQWKAYNRPKFNQLKKKFAKLRIEYSPPQFLLDF